MSTETLNLLPPKRRTELRLRHRLHLWVLASVAYGVVTLGACIALAAGEPIVDHRETRERSNLVREKEMFEALKKQHNENIKKENQRKQGADLVANHPDWSILFDLLATNRGDDAVLVGVDVNPVIAKDSDGTGKGKEPRPKPAKAGKDASATRPDSFEVKLDGFASSQTAVADFADRLQRIDVFSSVTLQRSSTRLMDTRPVVDFVIVCRLEASVAPTKEER